jgi:hypothetical protein
MADFITGQLFGLDGLVNLSSLVFLLAMSPSLLLRDWVPFGFGIEPGFSGQPWSAYGSYLGAPNEWFDLHLPLVPLL